MRYANELIKIHNRESKNRSPERHRNLALGNKNDAELFDIICKEITNTIKNVVPIIIMRAPRKTESLSFRSFCTKCFVKNTKTLQQLNSLL